MKTASILVLICIMAAIQSSSAQTVAVGNCQSHIVSYSTISAAVAAVAPNSTVLVCPGTYPEQVTISQPLTLKGLKAGTGGYPVITVPTGGLEGDYPAQLLAQQPEPFGTWGPVDISNLIVDGAGSGFNCSNGDFTGITYVYASGSLHNVEVRNQNPGGCGFGISLAGSNVGIATVKVVNSSIHDFDNTGIEASDGGGSNFEVTLTSNQIISTNPSVQAGVEYGFAQGLAEHNLIILASGIGLDLDNFFCCMTANENSISGSNVGIYLGGNDFGSTTTVTRNLVENNGTGIFMYFGGGEHVINSNFILQSSTAAIDLSCSSPAIAEHNVIFSAPIGIADIPSGDTVTQNGFLNVATTTTVCP